MIHHYNVTADNIDEALDYCAACDQAAELEPGCETWSINLEDGQIGQMTVWPDRRGTVSYGANSVWGKWDARSRTLRTDDGDVIDIWGDVVA